MTLKTLYCRIKKVETGITIKTKSESRIETASVYLQLLPGEYPGAVPEPYRTKIVEVSCDACGWFTQDLYKLKDLESNNRHWSVFDAEQLTIDYDYLRALIKSPYTLTEKESQAIKDFIKRHGFDDSKFDWFLEMSSHHAHFASTEIQGLLDFVDRMEKEGLMINNLKYCEQCQRYKWFCSCGQLKIEACDCSGACVKNVSPKFACLHYMARPKAIY